MDEVRMSMIGEGGRCRGRAGQAGARGGFLGAVRRGARRGRRGGRVHVTPALVSLPLSRPDPRDAVCRPGLVGVRTGH